MLYSMSVWDQKRSKYEICQNITTEIYKRIDLTFAMKELESKEINTSDVTDSNELSNATDLFAYDSLSSSVTLEEDRKIININNNEEIKKPVRRVARVKKRYRKRVKKKQKLNVDCSSDEEPLSRIVGENKLKIQLKNFETDSDVFETERDDDGQEQEALRNKAASKLELQQWAEASNTCDGKMYGNNINMSGPSKLEAALSSAQNLVKSDVTYIQPSAMESVTPDQSTDDRNKKPSRVI